MHRPLRISIPRRDGDAPERDRPLRYEPVRRDEVRIYRRFAGSGPIGDRVTMPLGTYRFEDRGEYRECFVAVPGLWQALIDELKAEYAERAAYWKSVGLPSSGFRPPSLEISNWNAREYVCEVCGTRFLDHRLAGNMVRLCSDKCERTRRSNQQRQRRDQNPPDYREHNAKRDQQRADARAGRTCEHCGALIEAARSTRRFCSDLCRIRAHHQRRRLAAGS